MTSGSKPTYKCQYCGKAFVKESTLTSHACEQKRRAQQQNETGVQLGFKAYLRFYQTTQAANKTKTYEDFATSPYYTAFVKFGRHLVGIRAVNPLVFIDWLLKNNKKLDYWTKDAFYAEWLAEYMKKEAVQDAMERALKEMTNYAEEHPELRNGFTDYFRYANGNRICHHISTGRISPWVVYNCASGVQFLDTLSEEQIEIVLPSIDPDFWQRKFKDYPEDVEWVKMITEAAGL
jgi:hypothetical protein